MRNIHGKIKEILDERKYETKGTVGKQELLEKDNCWEERNVGGG